MQVPLSDFRSEVLTEISDCPVALVDRATRRAAIDFCEYTLTWRRELDPHYTWQGGHTLDLDLEPQSRIAAVLYVQNDGIKVVPATESKVDSTIEGWRNPDHQSSVAQYFFLPTRETLRLVLTPESSKAVSIIAALKPIQGATKLPGSLYEDHVEAIGYGAKSKLLSMRGRPWSDPKFASYNKTEFERAKKREKAERLNDYTRQSSLCPRPVNYYG